MQENKITTTEPKTIEVPIHQLNTLIAQDAYQKQRIADFELILHDAILFIDVIKNNIFPNGKMPEKFSTAEIVKIGLKFPKLFEKLKNNPSLMANLDTSLELAKKLMTVPQNQNTIDG